MDMGLGGRELLILLLIALLLFGATKLPALARSLGRSARILKAESKGLVDEDDASDAAPAHGNGTGQGAGTQRTGTQRTGTQGNGMQHAGGPPPRGSDPGRPALGPAVYAADGDQGMQTPPRTAS